RLWGTDARDVLAVGDAGTIAHFDGDHWSFVRSGTRDDLVAIAGRAAGDAWAVGRERTILRLHGGAWHRFIRATDADHKYEWLEAAGADAPDAARPVPPTLVQTDKT